jgi:hypothetical protein
VPHSSFFMKDSLVQVIMEAMTDVQSICFMEYLLRSAATRSRYIILSGADWVLSVCSRGVTVGTSITALKHYRAFDIASKSF